MYSKRYYIAHNCPECGIKDDYDAWSGARMWSSEWKHSFSCCSDECGFKFAKIVEEKQKTKIGRKWLSDLWQKLQSQSDSILSGEPYYGYEAEQVLKNRKF